MLGTKTLAVDPPDTAPTLEVSVGVERAYRVHGAEVFRVALRLGRGDRAWAEDVTHEVFMGLFDRWHTVRDPSALPAWLYRATVHRCINRLRRERLLQRSWVRKLVVGWRSPSADPERVQLGREQLDEVLARVSALPDKQRVVFCMRHFDDRTGREISEIVGHSEGYVSKLLAKAEAAVVLAAEEDTGHA